MTFLKIKDHTIATTTNQQCLLSV